MNKLLRHLVGILALGFGLTAVTAHAAPTFSNPVYENGADPWIVYYHGNYYSATTTWNSQLNMRKSPTLAGLANSTPVTVWSETNPTRCCNFWAFEFHRLKGPDGWRWYMLFTSGDNVNLDHQHLSVLESVGDDPMGPYQYKGSPMPNSWNIDGSYLSYQGKLYLLYSQWNGDEQTNFIVAMSNPWTIQGDPTVITRPRLDWERVGTYVNEGPEAIIHNGHVFITYSASSCDTPDYKLGLLELTGNDPLDPNAWTKSQQPVFSQANGVYGPGHNGFFKSPDGTEDWLAYHGNAHATDGCSSSRALRAQPFSWGSDGRPVFGQPVASGQPISVPSGENGPMTIHPNGLDIKLTAADHPGTHFRSTLDPLPDQQVRLVNSAGLVLSNPQCGNGLWTQWTNDSCQKWRLETTATSTYQLINVQTETPLYWGDEAMSLWRLSFENPVAIVSSHSGKVLTLDGNKLVQRAWNGSAMQQWNIKASDEGPLRLKSAATGRCVIATGNHFRVTNCGQTARQWLLTPQPDDGFSITNTNSSTVITDSDCSLADDVAQSLAQPLAGSCQTYELHMAQ